MIACPDGKRILSRAFPPPKTLTRRGCEMKQAFELAPLAVFGAVYFLADIYAATGALMVAVAAQVLFYKLRKWPITGQMWLVFWLAMVIGTATLLLRSPVFIQWKPTIVGWIMGLALIGSRFVGKGDFIERHLGGAMKLSKAGWRDFTWVWAIGFMLFGCLNLYVAWEFSEQAWVTYRLASAVAIPVILVLASAAWLSLRGEFAESEEEAGNVAEPPG
ncbi:MAG: septation protein IspZ [Gammaproteobacteria bacterium]|nr:septation protein IspZ [Gammaproteobacteria bacterium]MYB36415.1 septation protein IspZ [Gammaproteobacteria bacterium]